MSEETKLDKLDPFRAAWLVTPSGARVSKMALGDLSKGFRTGFWEGVVAATKLLNKDIPKEKRREPWQVMKEVSGETWGV